MAALAIAVGTWPSCSLTSGDFEPVLTERAPLAPASPERAPLAPSPCDGGLACPGGDCGADGCVPSACAASEDRARCVAAWCPGGSCVEQRCDDGRLGPGEADIDCGGPCDACAPGSACTADADCALGGCVAGLCSAPSCADGVRNGEETGADCGGGCGPCADGAGCASGSDCQSGACGACAEGRETCCAPPSCVDGVTNGAEAAVDCGGGCAACPLGAACAAAADCASNVCVGGSCGALCANGQRDGDESAVDCGGSETGCPRCGDGLGCIGGSDCESGRCDAVCVSCADGIENGDELGLDCGSSELNCPACPRCDEQSSVALGPVGSATSLRSDGCAMLARFAGYPPTLIESFGGDTFPVPVAWRQECTGALGAAVFERQFQQLRLVGITTDCPVFIELGGGSEPFELRWY